MCSYVSWSVSHSYNTMIQYIKRLVLKKLTQWLLNCLSFASEIIRFQVQSGIHCLRLDPRDSVQCVCNSTRGFMFNTRAYCRTYNTSTIRIADIHAELYPIKESYTKTVRRKYLHSILFAFYSIDLQLILHFIVIRITFTTVSNLRTVRQPDNTTIIFINYRKSNQDKQTPATKKGCFKSTG